MSAITRAAVIGGGVIGAGWVARLIEHGIDLRVYDPAPGAAASVDAVLANSRHAYARLLGPGRRREGEVLFCRDIDSAVATAELVIEAVPERLDIKQQVYADIERAASATTLIASSTSGIKPSDLQARMAHPERLLVAHPFNPVYLLPLVELVGGELTAPATLERAVEIYTSLGMHPLVLRKEIEAFIADRLLEAIWRESLWLVRDGVATTQDIDDAVRYGFGLRYAQMGVFDTYRVAGGEAGMRHFLAQFGPCLQWPWTRLTDVPEFNDELVELIAGQSDLQSGHLSIREMERIRDDNLVDILRALEANAWGAGQTLARQRQALGDAANDDH